MNRWALPRAPARAISAEDIETLVSRFEFECRLGGETAGRKWLSERLIDPVAREEVLRVLRESSSLLRDRGKGAVLTEALAKGDQWFCPRCQGLISDRRREVHWELWCEALNDDNVDAGNTNDCKSGGKQQWNEDEDVDMG